jgi:hypothetical protein
MAGRQILETWRVGNIDGEKVAQFVVEGEVVEPTQVSVCFVGL